MFVWWLLTVLFLYQVFVAQATNHTMSYFEYAPGATVDGALASTFFNPFETYYYRSKLPSMGDFNGDGVEDFVYRKYVNDRDPTTGNYYVFLKFGQQTLSNQKATLDATHWEANEGVIFLVSTLYADAGFVGDVNNDGYEDLVLAYNSWIYLVFGEAQPPARIMVEDCGWTYFDCPVLSSPWFYGHVTPAGDINHDGFDDILIIGYEDGYLFFGRPRTQFANDYIDISKLTNVTDGFYLSGIDAGVGRVDLNHDGIDDLLLGTTQREACWEYNGDGALMIIYGRTTGFPAAMQIKYAYWNTTYGTKFCHWLDARYETNELTVQNAGDINGDGYHDFAMGLFATDNEQVLPPQRGIYLLFGRAQEGWNWTVYNLTTFRHPSEWVFINRPSGDTAVPLVLGSLGDVNYDGIDDLLIQSSSDQGNILYGNHNFTDSMNLLTMSAEEGYTFDQRGYFALTGDWSGDGRQDLAVVNYQGEANHDYYYLFQTHFLQTDTLRWNETHRPTSQPSSSPTSQPSRQPTTQPSSTPTGPTAAPTPVPTVSVVSSDTGHGRRHRNHGHLGTGGIIGVAIGGAAVVLLIVAGILYYYLGGGGRRRSSATSRDNNNNHPTTANSTAKQEYHSVHQTESNASPVANPETAVIQMTDVEMHL